MSYFLRFMKDDLHFCSDQCLSAMCLCELNTSDDYSLDADYLTQFRQVDVRPCAAT